MALFFSFSSHSPSLPLCWLFSEPNFLQAACSPATCFSCRTFIKYSTLQGTHQRKIVCIQIKGFFYIGNCTSLHFQSFMMIVGWWVQGAGRCTLQGGRGGLFSTKEQQAGRQAGWGGGADIRYCQLSAGNPSLLPGTSMLSKVD